MSDQRNPGRPKGSKNKYSTALMRQAVRNSGLTPLEYLTSVYQDEKQDQKVRIVATMAAGSHPKPTPSKYPYSKIAYIQRPMKIIIHVITYPSR